MASERLERDQIVLRNSTGHVMNLYPIHFAGMGVFMRNDSNNPTTVRVHESADGVTWNLVLFSTHTASGLPSITMTGLSYAVILFVSTSPYVRLSLTADNNEGVYCSLVQYPPKPRVPASQY